MNNIDIKLDNNQLREANDKKLVAGLLGILIGGLAIHKLYLGYTKQGIIQIILFIISFGILGIIGFIEGIIYITKSDEEFYIKYIKNKKTWF